jgi:hypothetical protein
MGTNLLSASKENPTPIFTRYALNIANFRIYQSTGKVVSQILRSTALGLEIGITLDNSDHHGPDALVLVKVFGFELDFSHQDLTGLLDTANGNLLLKSEFVDGEYL